MSGLSLESNQAAILAISHRNEAVALGAVYYFVAGRTSKFTYGVFYDTVFDSSDSEHVQRSQKSFENAVKERRIPGRFDIMLARVRYAQSAFSFLDRMSLLCRVLRF